MSSHHIVREKQEPALLVLGLENFPDELLGQLLEWSPTVITTQNTAEKLDVYGIKFDGIITNSIDGALQSDIKVIPAGNGSLIETGLNYLIEHNYPSVNIITDELNLTDYLQFAEKINLVIFNNHQKIYPVSSGFSKWMPAAEIIELLTPVNRPEFTGLEHVKENQYKTKGDGLITLCFDEAFVFIAEILT